MTSYGEYNGNLVIQENKDTLDTKNTKATNAIKKTIIANYTSSDIRQGPYLGYIIKKYNITSDEEEGFFSFLSSSNTLVAYKVRIPELDAHIPEPENYENPEGDDVTYVDMHPTYYLAEDIDDDLTLGDKVFVERDLNNVENNFIVKILKQKQEPSSGEISAKQASKSTGNSSTSPAQKATKKNNIQPSPDSSEEEKWNAYSYNSGNPRKIDIVTKIVNEQKITLSRQTMSKYENFIDIWESKRKEIIQAGLGDPGNIKYILGEAFRVWTKETGNTKTKSSFKSGLQYSIHNYGNAIDMRWNSKYYKNPYKKYTANYINLIIHCAQNAGFTRFGIGGSIVHMDTGVSEGGNVKNPSWWVYKNGSHTSKINDKKWTYKINVISKEWIDSLYTPPNLKNWDYMSVRYGPDMRNIG